MKIVIVGNAIAGQTAAQEIIKKSNGYDKKVQITMISKEDYTYYSRIFLPHYIAGEKTKEKMILKKPDWFDQKGIELLLGTEVDKIDTEMHEVIIKDSGLRIKYDKLILATGSSPRKIPFGFEGTEGLFALRTMSDADKIIEYIKDKNVKDAFVIGGGLLGIELGYHLQNLNLNVTICEIFPYLLPRQLCMKSSSYLYQYLEGKGLKFVLGKSVKKIQGKSAVTGIEMEDGNQIPAQIVFEQLGIIPNTEIAKNSGLKTNKGTIVNKNLLTSNSDIYAVGDCIEFNGQIWGIIPASMEQAKYAVSHLFGDTTEPYQPTTWNTRLKIAGLELISLGEPDVSADDMQKAETNILWNIDDKSHVCRKVIIKDGKLSGTILIGSGADHKFFMKNMGKSVDLAEIKKKL